MAAETIITGQNDMVDLIALRHYGDEAGYTEAIYDANPGLADLGPILPMGTTVFLPDLPRPDTTPTVQLVSLWD